MRKLFKERKLFKGGNYMRKYGIQTGFCQLYKDSKWKPNLVKYLDEYRNATSKKIRLRFLCPPIMPK